MLNNNQINFIINSMEEEEGMLVLLDGVPCYEYDDGVFYNDGDETSINDIDYTDFTFVELYKEDDFSDMNEFLRILKVCKKLMDTTKMKYLISVNEEFIVNNECLEELFDISHLITVWDMIEVFSVRISKKHSSSLSKM